MSSTSINVTWKRPSDEEGTGSIEGFYVGYKERGSSLQYTFKPIQNVPNGDLVFNTNIYDLKRFTEYLVVVQAYNSRGAGPPSEEIFVRTLEYDPPGIPSLKITNVTTRSFRISWSLQKSTASPVAGYILHYRNDNEDWREAHITGDKSHFVLQDLRCGTSYSCYLVAFNSAGKGNASDVFTSKTDGNAPIAPEKRMLLSPNSSSVLVYLNSWYDGGCPISFFVVQYKISGHKEWILVSNNVLPQQKTLKIGSLTPGTWYSLLMTARNDAGSTDAEYVFATLTLTGEVPPPLSETSDSVDSIYRHLTITLPVMSSVFVLLLVLCVVCFASQRRPGCRARTPDGVVGEGSTKPEQMSLTVTYDATEAMYIPTPYASSRVPTFSHKQQQQHCGSSPAANRDTGTFGSIRSSYVYDVPCLRRAEEENKRIYEPPIIYFPSYCHSGLELIPQAIYEVPNSVNEQQQQQQHISGKRLWREAGDGNSSTESDNEDLLYTLQNRDDTILKDEARESETECDRLWKTFEGSQYEAVTR